MEKRKGEQLRVVGDFFLNAPTTTAHAPTHRPSLLFVCLFIYLFIYL
jgi:hypothetical protein